jgi:hypothetical protein
MTEEHRSTAVLAVMAAGFFLFLLLPSLSPHYGFYSDIASLRILLR